MIHYSELVGTLRFYAETTGDPYGDRADYVGVGTVVWETEDTIFLVALRATLTRAMQRDLLAWLVERGIRKVKAHRAPGRTLPFARRVDDHLEIDVDELVERVRQAEVPKPHRRAEDDVQPAPPTGRPSVKP